MGELRQSVRSDLTQRATWFYRKAGGFGSRCGGTPHFGKSMTGGRVQALRHRLRDSAKGQKPLQPETWRSHRLNDGCSVATFLAMTSLWIGLLGSGLSWADGDEPIVDDASRLASTESSENASGDSSDRRPNIVLMIADDLGFSDLGCYGGEIQTPNLDRLGRHGLRMTDFYNTGRCWPTRSSLLTGYYPQQIHRDSLPSVPGGARGRRPSWAKLLPEYLAASGYRSYHVGKWHIDGDRLEGGFDHSYHLQDHNRYFAPNKLDRDDQPLPPIRDDPGYFTARDIADQSVAYLRDHQHQYPDEPFFAYVAFMGPHFPLQAPPETIAKYRGVYDEGWDVIRKRRWQRVQQELRQSYNYPTLEPEVGPPYAFPEDWERLGGGEVVRETAWQSLSEDQRRFQSAKMEIHAAMVDEIDQAVGRIQQQVRAMGREQNTLMIFLSDNGASAEIMIRGDGHDPSAAPGSAESYLCLGPGWSRCSNTPMRRHKTWVHEGGTATPLIAFFPASIEAGRILRTPAHVIDIVPTLLDAAKTTLGASQEVSPAATSPTAAAQPGKSLWGDWIGGSTVRAAPPRDLWWLHDGNRALRRGRWKVVAAADQAWELFDLATDRAEQHDLSPSFPHRKAELIDRWEAITTGFAEAVQAEKRSP